MAEQYYQQIFAVVELIGYMLKNMDGYTIVVPKDNVAISVAESTIIPENVSYKVIVYNHHINRGNVDAKKGILLKSLELLEPKRKEIVYKAGACSH